MLTLADVLAAEHLVRPYVWSTPLAHSHDLSCLSGGHVYLKLECWQRTGSFKVRGALSRLARLTPEERAKGVVTASAGNHGLGVAFAAQAIGLRSVVIFVPEDTSATKLGRLAAFDCQVRRAGAGFDEAHGLAVAYAREQGALYISAYDEPQVIAGQGTVGMEILQDLPDADLLLVPVGGGGLIAGVAVVARAIRPGIRIVGLQPEASPAAYLSLRDGRPYEVYPAAPTMCDGLAGGFGRLPFEIARELIDDVLVVPEPAIRHAVAWLVAHELLLVEASGAIAIAPLLAGQLAAGGRRVAAVLTGRNLDPAQLRICLEEFREP